MAKPNTSLQPATGLATVAGETTLDKINNFLALVPTVDEDPTEVMLKRILESPDPTYWKDVFETSSLRDNKGHVFRINTYRTLPSTKGNALKFYLLLDVTNLETGEHGVLNCSSQMATAQILNAEARVGLPIEVEIVEKDKDTKKGFRPIHLRYIGKKDAPLGDPGAVVSEQ